MTDTNRGVSQGSLGSRLWFPISGNPIGFNHLAAAEWLLRRNSDLSSVAFLLSNGRHPDPTKADAEVPADVRRELCELAIEAGADPTRSFLARQAELAGDRLAHVAPAAMQVSTLEFTFDRAVRSVELLPLARAEEPGYTGRLHWFAGSDLIARMADPDIFAGRDVAALAEQCHYHVLERAGMAPQAALDALRTRSGVALSATVYTQADMPPWLATFLGLSSTRIRNAAEAGDPLAGLLPEPAARRIEERGLYAQGRPVQRVVNADGGEVGTRSELTLELESLRTALDDAARRLSSLLGARREAGQPHGLALVETTTGGLITAALAGRAGASRYFRQARFAYDAVAKSSLVGGTLPGSAVEEAAVLAMAHAMRGAAEADFAIAESGMAGPPDAGRRSLKYGLCAFAVVGPRGEHAETLRHNPFLTRREHQLRFAAHALTMAADWIEGGAGS